MTHQQEGIMETEARETFEEDRRESRRKCSCTILCYDGNKMAKGFAFNGMSRGAIVMSNLIYSSSLIYLANEAAGCLDKDDKAIEDCGQRVHGFAPASLIANIAVVSGILSAFFMPLFGAIVDYTSHRWTVGVGVSTLIILVHIVQIGTVSQTWFAMLILQALNGFFYQILVMSVYAYLPDMAQVFGQTTMTTFNANFTAVQFLSQFLFLILVLAVNTALGLNDGGRENVKSAQVSQAINVIWTIVCFGMSWRLLEHAPAVRILPRGSNLLNAGFRQVGHTIQAIYKNYPRSLGVYYPAVVFAESATNSFTVVSVIYLSDFIGLKAFEIALFFLVALFGVIPGTQLGAAVTHRINPKNSWRLALSCMFIITVGGCLILRPKMKVFSFIWGFCIGITLGWHYPTQDLIFSLCLPRGQNSELSGFFVYCTQILGWLPPLIFSALVQADVSQSWGVLAVSCFAVVAIIIISMFPAWDDVLVDVARNDDPVELDLPSEVTESHI